jgi:hypothetical protein
MIKYGGGGGGGERQRFKLWLPVVFPSQLHSVTTIVITVHHLVMYSHLRFQCSALDAYSGLTDQTSYLSIYLEYLHCQHYVQNRLVQAICLVPVRHLGGRAQSFSQYYAFHKLSIQ